MKRRTRDRRRPKVRVVFCPMHGDDLNYSRRSEHESPYNFSAYIRRPQLKIYPANTTLRELYHSMQMAYLHTTLMLPDGEHLPKSDEYLRHYFQRKGHDPWHKEPECFHVQIKRVALRSQVAAWISSAR